MERPPLKFLHLPESLVALKLDQMRKSTTEHLTESLQPGQPHALKVRPDGTLLDGRHRVQVLKERGVDVDALPRQVWRRES